jgi:hypothetical protein
LPATTAKLLRRPAGHELAPKAWLTGSACMQVKSPRSRRRVSHLQPLCPAYAAHCQFCTNKTITLTEIGAYLRAVSCYLPPSAAAAVLLVPQS